MGAKKNETIVRPRTPTKLIRFGYIAILAVFFLGFLASFIVMLRSEHQITQVLTVESEIFIQANQIDKAQDEIAIALRGYLLTGDEAYVETIQEDTRLFRENLSDIKTKPLRPATLALLSRLEALEKKYDASVQQAIQAKRLGRSQQAAEKLFEEKISPHRLELSNLTESLVRLKKEIFDSGKKSALNASSASQTWTVVVSSIALFLAIIIGWFFSNRQVLVVKQLDQAIAELQKSEAELQKSEAELQKSEAELQKSEAELQKQNLNLEQAVRSRDEMAGVISHELKNPLTALQMGTALIQKTLPEDPKLENVRKLVERLTPSIRRMNQLISDLLDVTRLEASALKLEPRSCNLFEIVQEVVKSHDACAQEKLVQLSSEIQPECRDIFCDPERTIQVLINLVNNAIKFTNAGGSVTVSAKRIDHQVEVRVTDTGKGIPRESLPHVFDRFWQAKETAYKGTGLGLSIAQGLVVAQGGKIWVESQMGLGTTFYFTLPLATEAVGRLPKKTV